MPYPWPSAASRRGSPSLLLAIFHNVSSIRKLDKVRTLNPHGILRRDRHAPFTRCHTLTLHQMPYPWPRADFFIMSCSTLKLDKLRTLNPHGILQLDRRAPFTRCHTPTLHQMPYPWLGAASRRDWPSLILAIFHNGPSPKVLQDQSLS